MSLFLKKKTLDAGSRPASLSHRALDRDFVVAGGSVCGWDHRRTGKNNQDAFSWSTGDAEILAVVADGCSSGARSELGARLGVRLLISALRRGSAGRPHEDPINLLETAHERVLDELRRLLEAMGGEPVETVRDHFLFTLIGVWLRCRETVLFSLGDGVFEWNGVRKVLDFPGNAPPYLGYALIPEAVPEELSSQPFQIHARVPTHDIDSLVIGTDGVLGLGSLAEIRTDDHFWRNPQAIRRHLSLLNRERVRFDQSRGLVHKTRGQLSDDTTLILIRRRR